MTTESGESQRASKRRKVTESCKLCRAKKTRCDGHRPTCAPCREKQVPCEYNDATTVVSAGAIENILARLQRLEEQSDITTRSTPIRIAASDHPEHDDHPGMIRLCSRSNLECHMQLRQCFQ